MQALMPWIIFVVTGAIMVVAANKLAEYGDVIAVRTGLGGMLVGTILLAGSTSLPEIMTSVTSFRLGAPELAAGNFFGSNMVNMALLAIVDMINYQVPVLRTQAINQTLTAALAALLIVVATLFLLADLNVMVGWIGLGSLVLILFYFAGLWLLRRESAADRMMGVPQPKPGPEFPSLRRGLIGFAIAAGVILLVVPPMVQATNDIAEMTGLGQSFAGIALLGIVTSLPELLSALAAIRIGATELAVGNLFGSNAFNMFAVGLVDFLYVGGSFLDSISNEFALVNIIGLLMVLMAMLANLSRIERRVLFLELDALAILIVYLLGMYLIYMRGIGI